MEKCRPAANCRNRKASSAGKCRQCPEYHLPAYGWFPPDHFAKALAEIQTKIRNIYSGRANRGRSGGLRDSDGASRFGEPSGSGVPAETVVPQPAEEEISAKIPAGIEPQQAPPADPAKPAVAVPAGSEIPVEADDRHIQQANPIMEEAAPGYSNRQQPMDSCLRKNWKNFWIISRTMPKMKSLLRHLPKINIQQIQCQPFRTG